MVYDLPDRDCAAAASNGEFSIANNGAANYKSYIDSIRKLDPEASTTDLAGSDVVLDVDDSADGVKAPTDNVSTVDVKATVESLFQDFFGGMSESFSGSATAEG